MSLASRRVLKKGTGWALVARADGRRELRTTTRILDGVVTEYDTDEELPTGEHAADLAAHWWGGPYAAYRKVGDGWVVTRPRKGGVRTFKP